MTLEDEKRLAEIRDLADEEKHCRCPDCDNRRLLLAKLDEEKRARTEAENDRATLTEQHKGYRESIDRLEAALRDGELRRREDYFPEVAKLRQRNRDMHDRAQKAEAALAEERKGGPHNYVHKSMFAQVKERAETYEARVAELEGIAQSTASGRMREERDHYRALLLKAQNRIIELEAATAQQKGAE